MKLIHLSDLHIGKRVNEFSMIEDQEYILKQILKIIDEEVPDGVIIAGDVYDKPVPSAEAVELFDDFIVRLSERNLPVYIISGNHDSPERLAFGNRLMAASGIHFSSVYSKTAECFALTDAYGTTAIYLLPFIKPSHVRRFYPDDKIESYTDAIEVAVREMHVNPDNRNIIITHQFVTGALRSDSEELSVGGTDNVDASVFDNFDYVALGHIHRPQNVGSDTIRYCGSPLKYSFSEAPYKKSVTVVELKEKGNTSVRTVPLTPMREMVELKGTYEELTLKSFYENTSYREDYVHITLTDEEDIPDVVQKLRVIYRNLMKLDYDNKRTRHQTEINGTEDVAVKSPLALFAEFYEAQNGAELSAEQAKHMEALIEKIWEEQA
ncbi:MAG: exonuclease SbcCD subunit D [Ruminococcus sp.]|nr:exonuclease SbcCD subunit D [Ruminococcus sp.]